MQTRLTYYASSKRARAILGQRRSTFDLRKNHPRTAVSSWCPRHRERRAANVAALVGSSVLNLVDAVIREQGSLPHGAAAWRSRRRGRDAVDARRGLRVDALRVGQVRSQSFILATQSLAKLDDLSRTMRDTILANVGCLAVFQVAGSDAQATGVGVGQGASHRG